MSQTHPNNKVRGPKETAARNTQKTDTRNDPHTPLGLALLL